MASAATGSSSFLSNSFLQWLEGEGQSLIQFHLLQAKPKTLATHEDHNMSSSPTKKPKQAARLLWEVTALTVFHIFINTGFVLWYLKFIYCFTISPILYFWNSDYWPMIHTGQSVLRQVEKINNHNTQAITYSMLFLCMVSCIFV